MQNNEKYLLLQEELDKHPSQAWNYVLLKKQLMQWDKSFYSFS